MSEREQIIPSERPEVVPVKGNNDMKLRDRLTNALRGRRGLVLAGALALSGPYVSGVAQGLDPIEAGMYGTLRWITVGSENPPTADFIRQLRHDINTNSPQLQEDLGRIYSEMDDAQTNTILAAGVLGGLLIYVNRRSKRNELKKQSIAEGHEELKPEGEQIIVLAGKGNNIIDELANSGETFVPIYESSVGARELLKLFGNERPIYLNLDVDEKETGLSYLSTDGWNRLKLGPSSMINSKNGHRYLMVVGLGMKHDRELSRRPVNIDVTQDNLRSAALRIYQNLPPGTLPPRDIVDVYVGNGEIEHEDAHTGKIIKDRELAFSTGVDVYVDSTTVALKAIADELNRLGVDSVNLATTSSRYLERMGVSLPEFTERRGNRISIETDLTSDTGTWLVYEGSSEKTFMAARRLRKLRPDVSIIALVTSDLTEQARKGGLENVILINTSSIVAQIISDIRYCLREGITPDLIQNALDDCTLPLKRVPASE